MPRSAAPQTTKWSEDEIGVLAAIYFNSNFSIGDDARDECRAIADCFGRTPASIDRQWRNLDAVAKSKPAYNVGALVRQAVASYLANPASRKKLAIRICEANNWPLASLIEGRVESNLAVSQEHRPSLEIQDHLVRLTGRLEFKYFATGSQGYFVQRKIRLADGRRYQSQISAVLIGSKADMTISIQATAGQVADEVGAIIRTITAKTFRTGRTGYYGNGKVVIGSERFQVAIQAVHIKGDQS